VPVLRGGHERPRQRCGQRRSHGDKSRDANQAQKGCGNRASSFAEQTAEEADDNANGKGLNVSQYSHHSGWTLAYTLAYTRAARIRRTLDRVSHA